MAGLILAVLMIFSRPINGIFWLCDDYSLTPLHKLSTAGTRQKNYQSVFRTLSRLKHHTGMKALIPLLILASATIPSHSMESLVATTTPSPLESLIEAGRDYGEYRAREKRQEKREKRAQERREHERWEHNQRNRAKDYNKRRTPPRHHN